MRPPTRSTRPSVSARRPSLETLLRAGLRVVGWTVLAIVGALAFTIAAWVPPELAAMLGSRFSQSRTDSATPLAPRPPAERARRRGTPRTTMAKRPPPMASR